MDRRPCDAIVIIPPECYSEVPQVGMGLMWTPRRVRITRAIDTPARLQFFITRVVGTEDLPDLEILTLPAYKSVDAILNLNELQRRISNRDYGLKINSAPRTIDGSERYIAIIHQAIVDAQVRENIPQIIEASKVYAEEIFCTQPVPILNSPLTGSTLMKIVGAAGGSAAFMGVVNADIEHIALFFFLIGGTRIVLGAADGISSALKTGLEQVLLDWMGVPARVASARKRKAGAMDVSSRERRVEMVESSLDVPIDRKLSK